MLYIDYFQNLHCSDESTGQTSRLTMKKKEIKNLKTISDHQFCSLNA